MNNITKVRSSLTVVSAKMETMDALKHPGVPSAPIAPIAPKRKNSTYCCVPQCSTYSISEGIRFHHFPKDKLSRNAWKDALKIGNPVTDSDRVCSQHFLEPDYQLCSCRRFW